MYMYITLSIFCIYKLYTISAYILNYNDIVREIFNVYMHYAINRKDYIFSCTCEFI